MTRRGLAGVGGQYTTDGRRKSSMTHANRSWTCDCGRKVWGNGGKAGHQRACAVWAAAELARAGRFLADVNDPDSIIGRSALAAERRAQYEAEIVALRERLAAAAAYGPAGRTPAQAHASTLHAGCAYCAAPPGRRCRRRGGGEAQWPHAARDRAANEAGDLAEGP